uniref:Histone H1 n=1 Tax=Labrus bergylta TaxID=56723 RepID=A0A3Q3MWI3_9LABR
MAEVAPAPAKEAKKKAPKPKKTGPSVSELIVKYVSASKERSGVSVAAIKKLLANGGYDVEKNNSRVKVAIKSLVAKEILTQVKGIGASGSFKMNKKPDGKPPRRYAQNITHEGVHDTHGLGGDPGVGVDLLQDFVHVDGIALLPGLSPFLSGLAGGLHDGFLRTLFRGGFSCFGHDDAYRR